MENPKRLKRQRSLCFFVKRKPNQDLEACIRPFILFIYLFVHQEGSHSGHKQGSLILSPLIINQKCLCWKWDSEIWPGKAASLIERAALLKSFPPQQSSDLQRFPSNKDRWAQSLTYMKQMVHCVGFFLKISQPSVSGRLGRGDFTDLRVSHFKMTSCALGYYHHSPPF